MTGPDDLHDRQAASGRQGAAFEQAVATVLQIEGWTITATRWRHPEVDVEVDIVATHPDTGQEWWIECKGSWEGTRQGLKRTDTLKKALFNGAMLALTADRRPYMIVASHPPAGATAGVTWLERAEGIYVDRVRYLASVDGPDPQTTIYDHLEAP
jgi:Holliday junction resolvase-like predicted endonuclease